MNYLGIDYGLKHIGLAFSAGVLAEPLEQFIHTSDDAAMQKLADVCTFHEIDVVVVGLSEGVMADLTRAFALRLATKIDVQVVFQDETLTSQTAITKMIEGGGGIKKRQNKQHQVAAAVILQDYLDTL